MSPRNRIFAGVSPILIAFAAVTLAHADLTWPGTELSHRVQAWFAQMRGSEAEAREFYSTQLAPTALAEASVDARLERRRGMLERTGGLSPLEVLSSTENSMRVRVKAGNGDEPVAIIEAEAAPPHRITSVRLELGGPGGPGGTPPPPAGPPLADSVAIAMIRQSLANSARAGAFSGAVLVMRGDRPLLRQAWGEADRSKHTPLTPETRFNIGSIGKIPTRVALAQLAQAGKLSLDDKLSKYLPDFPRAGDITLAMLAGHRSGVGDFFNARYDAMDRSKLRHNHDYLQLIRDQPLWFEPGTQERYSNGGYALLGEVIAKASGMDYYDYLARNVFGPAGMKATAALIEDDGTPDVARGYTRKGAPQGSERDNAATRPARGSAAGGSYSTLDDLRAFDDALLGARFCNAAWSAWVIGGARPDHGGRGEDLKNPGFAYAGGAPGLNAEWQHDGDLTLIFFANRDPEVAQPVLQPVREILRRMQKHDAGPEAR